MMRGTVFIAVVFLTCTAYGARTSPKCSPEEAKEKINAAIEELSRKPGSDAVHRIFFSMLGTLSQSGIKPGGKKPGQVEIETLDELAKDPALIALILAARKGDLKAAGAIVKDAFNRIEETPVEQIPEGEAIQFESVMRVFERKYWAEIQGKLGNDLLAGYVEALVLQAGTWVVLAGGMPNIGYLLRVANVVLLAMGYPEIPALPSGN